MAKHILDRVAASLRPDARIADCIKTLADAEHELASVDARIAEAEGISTDPSVADADARKASQHADDLRLLKRRLTRGIVELRAAISAKEEARRSDERLAAYAEAKAARDALIERWQAAGEAYAQLIELIADTAANDQLLAKANRALPEGAEHLRSAEVEVRGASDDRWASGDAFTRFTSLELMAFDRPGFAWSLREAELRKINESMRSNAVWHAAAMAKHAAENTPEALAAKAEAEAARYSRYLVKPKRYSGSGRIRVLHRDGVAGIGADPEHLWLDAEQVDAAKASGVAVEPAPLKQQKALTEERVA